MTRICAGFVALAATALLAHLAAPCQGQEASQPDFPPLDKVVEGFEKVNSDINQTPSLYTIWVKKPEARILAGLPRNYESQKYFIAATPSGGSVFAGLQGPDYYVYWKPFDKRLALIAPNTAIRSSGDAESKSSVKRLFTDQVLLDTPILTNQPGSGPVIDLTAVLNELTAKMSGGRAPLDAGGGPFNTRLASITKLKAFPQNIEVTIEAPGPNGSFASMSYSISLVPDNPAYKPRKADERLGYFTTEYDDYGLYKIDNSDTKVRYINRWHLEKADPSLKVSPPKQPIVFYIEHTTPIRYRRWVREGALMWNKAFEKVGFANAIEVYYQDAATGAHMEKDPEDVRYNFLRWLNNNVSTAIGPSRAHPLTGQILDADIVLTDGWIRAFFNQFEDQLPRMALEGMAPEAIDWLDAHPDWDPRVRLAPPSKRDQVLARIAQARAHRLAHAAHGQDHDHDHLHLHELEALGLPADDNFAHLFRTAGRHRLCMAADCKAMNVALFKMHFELLQAMNDDSKEADDEDKDKENEKPKEKKDEPKSELETLIDGMPEPFIGPLLADLVAHEVGHTLGLRHNFKASSIYSFKEVNSEKIKGKKPFTASVMDYNPIIISMDAFEKKPDAVQGDYAMIGIGPYDEWAIEYGYTLENDLKKVTDRVADAMLPFGTDQDVGGLDPSVQRYDFGKEPLEYADNQMRLAQFHRRHLIEKFVKDGQSWSKALKGYNMTLSMHSTALFTNLPWIGGAYVARDKKGDPNARPPITVVPADLQRKSLAFVIENAFQDSAFGLTPEILARLTDETQFGSGFGPSNEFTVHDRIIGIQASVLTRLLNPVTLRRIYDNEFRVPADQDALTLPELMETLTTAIWSECDKAPTEPTTARKPLISSLRRNLQREHLERMIDLSLPGSDRSAASKPISDLATAQLKAIKSRVEPLMAGEARAKVDPYSASHLDETLDRINKVLNAQVIYNANKVGGQPSAPLIILLGDDHR